MRHLRSGRKLKRTSSHRRALLRNLATALFEHKKISTTEAKAKELRPYAESLITKAKNALKREKQGLLPEGQKIDIHNRRVVSRYLTSKAVLQELFDTIAPAVEDRPGGYTRIIKTGIRRGDSGRTAIIELVDWSAPQDGATSKRSRRKQKSKAGVQPTVAPKVTKPAVAVEEEQEKTEIIEEQVGELQETEIAKEEENIEDKLIVEAADASADEVTDINVVKEPESQEITETPQIESTETPEAVSSEVVGQATTNQEEPSVTDTSSEETTEPKDGEDKA